MSSPDFANGADRYAHVPTAMVYDTFAETAARLTGRYVYLSDNAASPEEREQWRQKVMELQEAEEAVPPYDRDQLIAHIQRWKAELARLKDNHG
ncbi:hypothetical protein [Streptomyces thermoalcalitolerans]|uniref:Uncharacterized protein n=1 Tax=Streptomyces thermoalcalitolerans TaxID=65605 RepID=A0ABN1PB55_9ACTN